MHFKNSCVSQLVELCLPKANRACLLHEHRGSRYMHAEDEGKSIDCYRYLSEDGAVNDYSDFIVNKDKTVDGMNKVELIFDLGSSNPNKPQTVNVVTFQKGDPIYVEVEIPHVPAKFGFEYTAYDDFDYM